METHCDENPSPCTCESKQHKIIRIQKHKQRPEKTAIFLLNKNFRTFLMTHIPQDITDIEQDLKFYIKIYCTPHTQTS
jgi:hypothetical protein